MNYYLKSEKGYWKAGGFGYTDNKEATGVFTLSQIDELGLNVDRCTLYSAADQVNQRALTEEK